MTENYRGCYEYLSAQYPEVGGYEFYKELFPDNENSGERHTDFSHPNAVYLYRDEQSEDKKLRRRKMYNDTWEQDYICLLYTSPSPRDTERSRMPSSA